MKNIIVVGTGFSGAVIARGIAEELGYKVRVIERRGHIGGNMYDEVDSNGILVQMYGPHIVCTDHYKVIKYLSGYSEFFKHTVKLLSFIDGKHVRLPFNFETLQQLVGAEIAEPLIAKMRKVFNGRDRVSVLELIENDDVDISEYGTLLFEKAYKPYIIKQWDIPSDKIDRAVIDRVQMAMSYDERYMNYDFQYLPVNGFTKLFENLLNHENISISLMDDALTHIKLDEETTNVYYDGELVDCLVFTGMIDELLHLKYGVLPYRSLKFNYDHYEESSVLEEAIVSYPQASGFTRKTEYRKMMFDQSGANGSVVATEYPIPHEREGGITPYYPMLTAESRANYESYYSEILRYKSIFLCGRLAEFKYYNMDKCILRACEVFEQIKGYLKGSS